MNGFGLGASSVPQDHVHGIEYLAVAQPTFAGVEPNVPHGNGRCHTPAIGFDGAGNEFGGKELFPDESPVEHSVGAEREIGHYLVCNFLGLFHSVIFSVLAVAG